MAWPDLIFFLPILLFCRSFPTMSRTKNNLLNQSIKSSNPRLGQTGLYERSEYEIPAVLPCTIEPKCTAVRILCWLNVPARVKENHLKRVSATLLEKLIRPWASIPCLPFISYDPYCFFHIKTVSGEMHQQPCRIKIKKAVAKKKLFYI
jgi:hypothetical protein